MGILAVAQRKTVVFALLEYRFVILFSTEEVFVDLRVVVTAGGESAPGQALAFGEGGRSVAVAQDLEQGAVVVAAGHTDHIAVVFSGRPDEGDASDVDLFDDLALVASAGDGFLKGIQIDHHQVDLGHAEFFQLRQVIFFPAGEESSVNGRMQCFDPSVENGGESGQFFYGHYFTAVFLNESLRSSGRIDRYTQTGKFFYDGRKTVFVVNGQQCGLDLFGGHGWVACGLGREISFLVEMRGMNFRIENCCKVNY